MSVYNVADTTTKRQEEILVIIRSATETSQLLFVLSSSTCNLCFSCVYWLKCSFFLRISTKQEESLLNPAVYTNVQQWDENQKRCVCSGTGDNSHVATCAVNEEDTCPYSYYYNYWTRVRPKYNKRSTRTESYQTFRHTDKRVVQMMTRWKMDIGHNRVKVCTFET